MKMDHPPLMNEDSFPAHATMAKDMAKHGAGHKPHAEMFKMHAAGHKMHDDHVESFCGGGKMKAK